MTKYAKVSDSGNVVYVVDSIDPQEGMVALTNEMTPPPNVWSVYNLSSQTWIDNRTLDQIKIQQWDQIKASRTEAEYAGFTWDGSVFDSDVVSQGRITGAVTLATLSSTFSIDWTLADNTVRSLNQSEMIQVGAALGMHVQLQFAKGQELRSQIDSATTKDQVESIVW